MNQWPGLNRGAALGAVLVVLCVTSLAACGGNDDFGPGLTVHNQTASAVSLDYATGVGPVTFVANLESGDHANFVSYFVDQGRPNATARCLGGSFLAKQGSRTIAEMKQPCEGVTWVITEPEGS